MQNVQYTAGREEIPMYNEEEDEINRLIDEAADEYQPLEEILKQHGLTLKEALI